ncbi:MAG: excinuclease ABC subunit A [Candidatus Omnitrophota bacterium]
MEPKTIIIKGAKEHNLKDIDVEIPRNTLCVITGLSGSGKSSLAFDTIYAEGQRRYVESLSSYARQFLEQLEKPNVEYIEGLSPAISIEQRKAGSNPRSTVGTQTEIYDYLRLLFARIGVPYCPKCHKEITRQSSEEISRSIAESCAGKDIMILAPVVSGRKGEYVELYNQLRRDGFIRARIDGKVVSLDDAPPKLHKHKKHDIEIVVDRIHVAGGAGDRLGDSVETALAAGKGTIIVNITTGKRSGDVLFSEKSACVNCGLNFEEPAPRAFSFNSPYGACPSCDGLGNKMEIDPDLVVPDKREPVITAIVPWRRGGKGIVLFYRRMLRSFARQRGFDVHTPFGDLAQDIRQTLMYGDGRGWGHFEGIIPNLERRFRETESEYVKTEINKCMSVLPCPACNGDRLKPESLSVKIEGQNIAGVTRMPVREALNFFLNLKLSPAKRRIAHQVLRK